MPCQPLCPPSLPPFWVLTLWLGFIFLFNIPQMKLCGIYFIEFDFFLLKIMFLNFIHVLYDLWLRIPLNKYTTILFVYFSVWESEKVGLKLNIQKTKIMASGPITSWEIDGEAVETVSDFIFWGSKITADGDCSHEIKRHLLLGRKVMTNLDTIFKSRDITLPTKVRLVKAMVFPVVMYVCEIWTVKKAERWRIDAFELWCWRRLLRVPWTARRSN